MEYKAEVTIQDTSVQNVMDHLSKPELVEKWAVDLVKLEPDENSQDAANLTMESENGTVQMENRFLYASDDSLTVRTIDRHFDVFSIWRLSEQNGDVVLRQLMLGTHRGFGRFTSLFNREMQETTMQKDLDRLKSFIETGEVAEPRAIITNPAENTGETDDQK